jgi:transcriptional regulator with XRE-family HTH domain
MDWRTTRAGKRWLALYGHRKKVRMTWLARARLLSGQSVAQAAKACGLSPRTWEAWERVGEARREPEGRMATRLLYSYSEPLHLYSATPYVTVSPATLEVIP